MERKPPNRHAWSLAGLGISLALLSLVFTGVYRTEARVGFIAGLVVAAAGIASLDRKTLADLASGLLVAVLVALAVGVVVLPEEWVEAVRPGAKLHPWIVRLLLLAAAQGIAVAVWAAFRKRDSFRTRRTAVAVNVTVLVEAAIALLVVVNAIGSQKLTRWLGAYDATESSEYTLGERTRGLLAKVAELPSPVHAIYLDFGSTGSAYGGEMALGVRGKDFLRRYGDACPNLVVRDFNGVTDLEEAESYLRDLGVVDTKFGNQDTVVFLYRDEGETIPNRKDVTVANWEFLKKGQLGVTRFLGEQIYTSAIQEVVLPKRKVYFLKGHGEHPLTGASQDSLTKAVDLLEKLTLSVEELNLAERGAMPKDSDLVVVAGPKTPLLPSEVEILTKWLDGGGDLILMVDPQEDLMAPGSTPWTTGLEPWLMEKMGLEPKTDHVLVDYEIAMGSVQGRVLKTFIIQSADYSYEPVVAGLRERGFSARFAVAAPVVVSKPPEAEGLKAEPLVYLRRAAPVRAEMLTYAARLYPGRNPELEDPERDLVGQRLATAALAERRPAAKPGGDEDVKPAGPVTRVVVFGDSDFATRVGLDPGSMLWGNGNATLLTNAVSWAVEREELISIEPKTLEEEKVTLSETQVSTALAFAVLALPLLALLAGIGVAIGRRR